MNIGADLYFPYAQTLVIVIVTINIYLVWRYRQNVGDYRKAIATPIFHWLFHVLLFYLITTPVRLYLHPNPTADDLMTYWSLVVRLHGQIAVGATVLGIASREGITWKQFLPKILRWRS